MVERVTRTNLPPVITLSPTSEKHDSPRYLGRSLSTISRELPRGADTTGRCRPFEAHRRALGRRRLHRPSRLARDATLPDWAAGRLQAR
jgi:IS30 family transposase